MGAGRGGGRRGWWRVWGATAAIVGTLAVVLAAAAEMWLARRAEEELVRDTMRRYAEFAAQTFGEHVQRMLADVAIHALAPVHGSAAWAHEAPMSLDALAGHLGTMAHAPFLARDSALALFRVDVRPGRERRVDVRPVGARADTAELRLLVPQRVAGAEKHVGLATPVAVMAPMPDGRILTFDMSWQLDARGRPVAILGIAGDGRHHVRRAASVVYANVSLLPPALAGESAPAYSASGWAAASNGRRVALRVRWGDRTLFASPNWGRPAFRDSPHRVTQALPTFDLLEVDAVLDPGARDVLHDTRARRASRALLAGVLALAAMLAVVALLGVRRQHQLARARELFVAAISHELRTPLTQIRVASETLLLDPGRSPEHTRRWARVIDREALRLGELVENALVFARAQRHEIRVAPRPLDLAPLVAAAADAARPLAEGRGARVAVEVPPALRVRADEWALRHVLLNLIDNAVKYGPDGQTVRVVAARAGGAVDLAVVDEGAGVPPADRERVWVPFVRVDERDGGGGTGLGLAVVRALVERQDGDVWVDDAPGGGARFTVRLPAA